MTIDDQVSAAVEAVRARDRKSRRYTLFTLTTILVFMVVGGALMTSLLLDQTKKLKEQNAALLDQQQDVARLLREAQTQDHHLSEIVCLITARQQLILFGLRHLAHQFGVDIPRIPDDVTQCPSGNDDVFVGTNGDDSLRGTVRADFMSGLDGDDVIRGKPGDDVLIAGEGRDVLRGGKGSDTLRAVEDDHDHDVLQGGSGHDTCYLRPGDLAYSCETVVRNASGA